MKVGVIFLSKGEDSEMRDMTQMAISTCIESDPDIEFQVLVMESAGSFKSPIYYEGALTTYAPDVPFNYNQFMNIARQHYHLGGSEYLALCNNDLVFTKGWATNIIKAMKKADVMSACPMEPKVHADVTFPDEGYLEGYTITANERHVAGWCIVQDPQIYDTITHLDTTCEFWHSDVFYAAQLQLHDLRHILVEDSKVHHLTSKTLGSYLIDNPTREYYMHGQDAKLMELIKRGYI